MSSVDGVEILADLLHEDHEVLRKLLVCPPAHFSRRTISRKGKRRPIAEPDSVLKRVQREIVRRVLRQIPNHPASFCSSGRSIIDNARRHLRNDYVYTFDVADAFPSTSHRLIARSLRRALAACQIPIEIAMPITALCTLSGALPQGAPTSSALLDITLFPVDNLLDAASKRHGARYSRYVDDITLSANCALPWAEHEVVTDLDRVNLRLRHEKTRKWAPPRRATVTGIVVRERLELPREYIRRVKAIITDVRTGRIVPSSADVRRIRSTIGHLRRFHPGIGKRLDEQMRATGMG
jgi:RNA-directed DNA polymerase